MWASLISSPVQAAVEAAFWAGISEERLGVLAEAGDARAIGQIGGFE